MNYTEMEAKVRSTPTGRCRNKESFEKDSESGGFGVVIGPSSTAYRPVGGFDDVDAGDCEWDL